MVKSSFITKLHEMITDGSLPLACWQHRVVTIDPSPNSPLTPCCALGAVRRGSAIPQQDSVIGFWCECPVTSTRTLSAQVRKCSAHKCGCQGWCSLYTLLTVLRWCFSALVCSVWPRQRHDGGKWGHRDAWRAARAGNQLPSRAAVDMQWTCSGDTDSDNTCAKRERAVWVDGATKELPLGAPRWDKRDGGAQGGASALDLPSLRLFVNDRLEPSAVCESLESLAVDVPVRLTFGRRSAEILARHRNTSFSTELGRIPNRSSTVDALHCLYLGVMRACCRTAIWKILLSGVFGEVGLDAHLQNAVLVMHHELSQWYTARGRDATAKPATEVSDMTTTMVGSQSHPRCKTKGAIRNDALHVAHPLEKYKERVGRRRDLMLRGGSALLDLVAVERVWPQAAT